ncbi:hypothetical protein R6Q57_000384 [Mikania cordata]
MFEHSLVYERRLAVCNSFEYGAPSGSTHKRKIPSAKQKQMENTTKKCLLRFIRQDTVYDIKVHSCLDRPFKDFEQNLIQTMALN